MAEKQEFYKLINDKTKVPYLTPVPQIEYLKNTHLEKNPLQKFRAQAIKFVRAKPPQPKLSDKWRSSVHRISKTFYTEELIKLARTIPIQGLPPEWEENILKLIPKTSKRKYIVFLMSIMKEVKQNYLKEMESFNVKSIVKATGTNVCLSYPESDFKCQSPNEDCNSPFNTNRELVQKKYFLAHRLIRTVSNIMFDNLPKIFTNFEQYAFEELHLSKLNEMVNNDLQRCSLIVQNKCYNEIIRSMLQMNYLKSNKRLPKLLHCAESFMVQQILNSMMNSINNFIESLKCSEMCIKLKLQLVCKNDGLETEPSINEISTQCHQIITNITNISQDLVPLGDWLKINIETKYIKVSLPEWFLNNAHNDLQKVLTNNFKPLLDHCNLISVRYSTLCSNVTKKQIIRLINKKMDFEIYYAEVNKFNAFLTEINAMPLKVYYNFGILNQIPAINDLKQNTSEIINVLVEELIKNHQELNRSICIDFENLEIRALTIPDDTKSLFELTDYVAYASKVLVTELEMKIQKSINMLCSLLQVCLLTSEHIELNKTTINWLELIKPVFSQHNIFCEAKKGELEDELQRKINLLSAKIDQIFPELVIIDDMDEAERVTEYREFLVIILNKIKQIDNQIESINVEERLFKFSETTFLKVDEIKEILSTFCSLIHTIYQWQRDNEVWLVGPFEYLDAQIIEKKTMDYFERITEMYKMYKVKIKSDLSSNKPFKFSGMVDDPDPIQQPAPIKLCWQTLQDLNEFKNYVPLAICMCNPALKKRHWDEMSAIAGINLLPNAGTTFKKIIDLDLLRDYQKYNSISIGATKESALEEQLNSMNEEWKLIHFSISIDERSELLIITETDRIDILLEDQVTKITKMRASYFITPIKSKVIDFLQKLCMVRDIMEYWNSVQNQCKYLNSLFSNEVVQDHLQTEVDLFKSLKTILQSIQISLSLNPTFHYITETSDILDKLKQGKYILEIIHKKINDYFEKLRLSFTRLFFLSDNEIIKLLFECEYLTMNGSYIKKCFPNINSLKMDSQFNILSVVGGCAEEIQLQKKISITTKSVSVTDWLTHFSKEINSTIRQKINENVKTFNNEILLQWVSNTPSMVIFCIQQIIWTSQIHSAFLFNNVEALKTCRDLLKKNKEMAQLFLKLNLSNKDRETIMSLIILFIHQEEVTNLLIERKIHEDIDFDWKSQIRYYYQDDQVEVIIINMCINYAYEYYSSCQKIIVNTPLTERCYRSLMEAYYQNYFGAIVGFSGVGKTETIKSLSRTLAMPFFIFESKDRQDYNSIGNIFKGLVTMEAWVHLKNFKQIKSDILSVIAQYIFRISQSRSIKSNIINIHGSQLIFNQNCYISFSLNPSLPNLSDIPDNLRLHFRTVCFMNPDLEKICQVELFAAGFAEANNLAISLRDVYNLCNDQMSSEKKYNFKLRNLKSVIKAATKLKLIYPEEQEQILLLRSLIDLNLSQYINIDIVFFHSILNKCFPTVSYSKLTSSDQDLFLKAVDVICANKQLSNYDYFELKILQLYEIIRLREAIILVGESFSGKSTILDTLNEALLLLEKKDNQDKCFEVQYEIINPEAVSIDRLYGSVDTETGKWNDGICPQIIRHFTEHKSVRRKWLIFDGNIHSLWIERLESTLEDNRTLFLMTNERIILTREIQILFETSNLDDASPSMTTRCGIVHFDSQKIDWRPLLLANIKNANQFKGYENFIYQLFDWSIDPCLKFIHKCCTVNIKLTDKHLVMSIFNLFKMYMTHAIEKSPNNEMEKNAKSYIEIWLQAAIIMSTNEILMGTLDFESNQKFEEFYLSLWNDSNKSYPCPNEIKKFEMALPTEGSLNDNIYIFKGIGNWKHCREIVKMEKIKETILFQEPFIPTTDSVKLSLLFNLHIKYKKPFILCGKRSNGKTSFIREYLSNLSESEYVSSSFNFNFITTSDTAQKSFLSKLKKIKRCHYEPLNNRYSINFIDDFSVMSNKESNSTLDLIRQYMDYGFFYGLNNSEKIKISNTMFIAALTTTREDSNIICQRLLKHFNVFTMYPQTKDNIYQIFSKSLIIDLKKKSISTDILNSISSIAKATVELYLAIVQNFRPTPSKILYHFSLHDIRKMIKGCILIKKESVDNKITLIRLWAHETIRVFGDRIINDDDNQWLFLKIRECLKSYFKDTFETVFDYLPKYTNGELTKDSFKSLFFFNFIEKENNIRKYEEIHSIENLKRRFLQYIQEYNEINKIKIDIVMTCHTIQHLVRICRILATPGGNLLMISSSGAGRKSLTRLAAFIQQQCLFEPMIGTHYNESTWEENIKLIMRYCATLKKDYTILLTDRQMKSKCIQVIYNFLSFGEISEIFSNDEKIEIIELIRLDAQKGDRNIELDMLSIFEYFHRECENRMHFILNISPIGKTLQHYVSKYPKWIDKCTINWFDCWPESAFEEIATHYMKDIDIQDATKSQVIIAKGYIYNNTSQFIIQYYKKTGRLLYISPMTFIREMKIYLKILIEKQNEIKIKKRQYLTGIDKLLFAGREILRLKSTCTKLKPQLEASTRQAEATTKEIETENINTEKAAILVKRDEEIANKKTEVVNTLKADYEKELAVAIPILEDAFQALDVLKPTDIALVKSMKNPANSVKLVTAAVCIMLNVPSERIADPASGKKVMDFWGPSKRLLGNGNFLQTLKDYDKDNISPSIITTIKKTYISDKNFNPQIVAKASIAAEGLCKWVKAMVSYDEVAKLVAPKKEKLIVAQRECDEIEALLNTRRKTLADSSTKLTSLKNKLETILLKKSESEKEIENCTKRLKKAEGLITSLGSQRSHWQNCVNKLAKLFDNLAGDALLSSGMITYLSSIDFANRQKKIAEWKEYLKNHEVPYSHDYEFTHYLEKEITINAWHLSGLSDHYLFSQNAVIMKNSPLWCLFIDPEIHANAWIRNMEKENNLCIVRLTDENFMNKIQSCMEIGNPVLLENLEDEFDVSLDLLLSRDIYKISETWYINIGQDIVLYSSCFRFYLTTRNRKPHYSPNVFNKLTIIEHCLPNDALQISLLDIVVFKEKPELQEKFEKILFESLNNKKIIQQQEDNMLHTLTLSNANILEDEEAIEVLSTSKNLTLDLLKRQEIIKAIKNETYAFRESYIHFAKYCADLYSSLIILPNLNYMYQFSLSWFTQLYKKSIETSNRSINHKKRIDYLKTTCIQNLHQSVITALFEKHRLVYSFILCTKILLSTEQVTEQEFNTFISINESSSTKFDDEILSNTTWLSDKSWREIVKISNSLTVFQNFANSFIINNTRWKKYCNSLDKDDRLMPSPWDNKLTQFQKLILIRILCPDKIILKIMEFVDSVMGQNNSSFIPCNISRPYTESTCLTPITFILPSYSSPFSIVNKFATLLGHSAKLHSLSMGPSQGQKAEILIEMARKNGEWVFLHNCHLDLPWMMKLEKICEDFHVLDMSLDFRLWISTQSNNEFPSSILQNSIKIAFDSPYEIKQTLTWAYKSQLVKDKDFFEGCPGKDRAFSKLLYGYCLFHSVIRERKYFGCQSWNFEYDFDESDLQISIIQLKNWINQYDKVPFKALTYLLGECNYGGKIMDVQDKIYLDNLISDYCNSKVISDPNYDFDLTHAYKAPKRIEYKEHLKHIRNNVPNHTLLEDFCLDKNIALMKNSNKVKDFVDSLSCLNETIITHSEESKNNRIQEIIMKILEIIPDDFNIEEITEKYKINDTELLNCVLIEEIKLYNNFLNIIRDSLYKLNEAYNGYLMWTDKMEEMSEEIFLDLVPKSWKIHICLYTKKVLSKFIIDLLDRIKFMKNWIENGHPHFYWFGGLLSCKKLLSVIKTIFARDKQVPIDQVSFQFHVLEIKYPIDDILVPENTIYVYGLYLVGARWNDQSKSLCDSKPNIFYNDMPVISFELILKKSINSTNTYKCPLYISPTFHNSYYDSETLLDNYVLSVNLNSNINPKIWIKRGTALYCQAE